MLNLRSTPAMFLGFSVQKMPTTEHPESPQASLVFSLTNHWVSRQNIADLALPDGPVNQKPPMATTEAEMVQCQVCRGKLRSGKKGLRNHPWYLASPASAEDGVYRQRMVQAGEDS